MTRRLILCAAAAAAFLPAAAAQAAVVSYSSDTDGDESGFFESRVLAVTAGAAEVNDMTITAGRDGFVVRDASATLQATAPCQSADPHTVRCDFDPLGGPVPEEREGLSAGALVDLGDGDDRLTYQSSLRPADESTTIRGGAGNDTITAVSGKVTLLGGEGADTLRGTANPDILTGGPGPDLLEGGEGGDHLTGDDDGVGTGPFAAPSADTVRGGPGSDTVSYAGHQAPVSVDLSDPGPHGAAGEQDRLNSIENAIGGAGDDVLRGTAGGDKLEGRAGMDTLIGRAGNDELNGESIEAGPGRDLIIGLLGSALSCGTGTDRIAALSLQLARRVAPADCELVDHFGNTVSAHPRLDRGRAVFSLRATRGYRATLTVFDGTTRLGVRRIRVPSGRRPLPVAIPIRRSSRRRTLEARLARARIGTDTWRFVPRSG